MEEKIRYMFLGFIFTTIIYGIIGVGVLYVANKKSEQIDSNPIKELGSFVCEDFNGALNTFNSEYVINDGYLYALNPNMKYSNEQNCKKISDIKINKVINNIYVAEDGGLYTYDSSSDEFKATSASVPSYLLGGDIVKAVSYGKDYEHKYYVLKTDGNLYKVSFNRTLASNGQSYAYTLTRDELYKSYEEEAIKTFNSYNDQVNLIVTDKAIYTNKITNPECMQYADVECELEFTKNEVLKESMDDIKYINSYNNSTVLYITKDNAMYSFNILES